MLCCLLSSTLLSNIDTPLRFPLSSSYILSPSPSPSLSSLALCPPLALSLFRYLFSVFPSLACGSSGIDVSCIFCCFLKKLCTRSHTGLALSVHFNIFHTTAAGPGSAKSHSKLATNQRQSTFPNTFSRTGLARSC